MRLPLINHADWLRILTTTLILAWAETKKQLAARAVKSTFIIEKFRPCSVSLDTEPESQGFACLRAADDKHRTALHVFSESTQMQTT